MIKGIRPQLAEGGKIKIGGLGEERSKTGGGTWRLPVKLDHFRITKTNRDENGDFEIDEPLMAMLAPESDGKIRAIPIVLHSDEIDEVFPTAYAMYAGKRLACRGDGSTATRWEMRDGKRTGEQNEVDCTCGYLGAKKTPMCKPHGTLHCSIAVDGHAVAGAVHKWRTTSIISIERMIGSLLQIKQVCGTLRGIPLWLQVKPIQVETGTVYCCHIELRESDIQALQLQAIKAVEMRGALANGDAAAYRALIQAPASDAETIEEQSEIAQEFYPEGASDPDEPTVSRAGALRQRIAPADPEIDAILAEIGEAQTTAELDAIAARARDLDGDREKVRAAWRERLHAIGGPSPTTTGPSANHAYGPPPMTDEELAQ